MGSADVCKALLERAKTALFVDLMDLFVSDDKTAFFNQEHLIPMLSIDYAHASDLLHDIDETLIRYKSRCANNPANKDLWRKVTKLVINFYECADPVFKRTCGQYYEPFTSGSILSSESFPAYSPCFKKKA